MSVRNMQNSRGNDIPNQFIIHRNNGDTLFQSHQSIIVKRSKGKIILGKDYKYSVTTGKYRNQFLGETLQETECKLKEGIYTLDENL
jgi:hypothetical protein